MDTSALSENKMQICEKLWNEHGANIKHFCEYKLSSCPSEVDEVVSDAFLALCNAVKNGTIDDNPKAWLYSTVNNLIKMKYTEINKYKTRMVDYESVKYELLYEDDYDFKNVSDETIEEIKNSILDELSDFEIEFLTLIYEDKKKHKEVAAQLGITLPAVKQRHYRLKMKIQQLAKERLENL